MRTRSRSSAAAAAAEALNNNERKEEDAPQQPESAPPAAVDLISPPAEQPPPQSQPQSQPQQDESVDLTSQASSTRRASRRSSAASRTAAARQPRRRSSNSGRGSNENTVPLLERMQHAPEQAAFRAESLTLAPEAAQHHLAAREAAGGAAEEKEEKKEEAAVSQSSWLAAAMEDAGDQRSEPRRYPRGRPSRVTLPGRRSTAPLRPSPRRTPLAHRRVPARNEYTNSRADPYAAPSLINDAEYDSAQDEDYEGSEHNYLDTDDSDELVSDQDEKEMEQLYDEAREIEREARAAGAVSAAQEAVVQYIQELTGEASPSRAVWVDRAEGGGVILGIPRHQQQHQHHHHHVHEVQRPIAQTHKITRNNIKERMAKKTTPKAKRGKARKGKRRRSSVAAKEEELAALLSQLEGPPSVPPMSCAEVDSLFRLATRSFQPVDGASSSSASSSTAIEVVQLRPDYSETELSPFISLFSDVRSLGASFLRPTTSSSSSYPSSSSSMSGTAQSASSNMVDVDQLMKLEFAHWVDSTVVWTSVERTVGPLLSFIDEWLAGQLPEPPTLVIDDIADEEAVGRTGKKRKGAAARTMSMVNWLQLMNAGIDPTTGGDVIIHGGASVPSSTIQSARPARASPDGGMIDLTDEGEAAQERKEAIAETAPMQVESETKVKEEHEMKEGKDEKVNELTDEDRPIQLDDPSGSTSGSNMSRATRFILSYHQGLTSSSSSSSSSSSMPSSSSSEPLSSATALSSSAPPSPPLSILTLVRNCVVTLLELHMFDGSDGRDMLFQSLRFLPNSTQLQQLLTLYFASLSPSDFQQHVTDIQDHLSRQLTVTREINEMTVGALHLLSTLFSAYQLARTRSRLLMANTSLFTNPTVNSDVDIYGDYHFHFHHHLTNDSHVTSMAQFTWTRHCRFLYTTEVKSEMIRHWLEQHWQNEQIQQAALPTQALTIHLSRARLVPDLLNAIARTRMERGAVELRKPLHVVFSGEEGIDAGGLRKECLTLACESMFNAQYGMFLWSDETRTFWFNAHCQAHDSVEEMKGEYQLLGTVIGMALLNNVLLPNVVFPPVVYAKLLGLPLSFVDLQSSFPQLHQSLSAILSYDGAEAVEDVFGLTFSVDSEVMGSTHSQPLLPNGESMPVTAINRHEYVKLFTKYQLEDSISVQFDAFARGFWSVLPRHLLAPLLQPVDLELLVCGQREMDFDALEAATKYEGFPVRGRHNQHSAAYQAHLNPFAPAQPVTAVKPAHPVIKHFWSIVHGLDPAQKKQLLHFVTGSSSVPVKGLSEVKLVIANGGSDVRLLPSSRTCFSTLMLPLYKTEAELKKKLLISIEHNTGFGMK